MTAGLRLDLRQTQQLVMTPQLQQAIKLLQMSNLELSDFVAQEIERNPLLAREEEGGSEVAAPAPEEVAETADSRLTEAGDMGLAAETFDTGAENLHDAGRADTEAPRAAAAVTGIGTGGDDEPGLEARLAGALSLREHLHAQIGQMRAETPLPQLARFLVEELDEAGYLRTDLGLLAARLDLAEETLGQALALLQGCEPTGVGARSLAECFRLQLAEQDALGPRMALLLDHLALLGEGGAPALRRATDLEGPEIAALLAELRRLDPRPGAAYGAEDPETRVPDILMHRDRAGGWQIELNPETLPRVLIDRTYATRLSAAGEETRAFLAQCREDAAWLVRSVDQRARTILKVATEIVRQQERFFAEGAGALRPLSLATVAEAIGMHESTVSRVTANKYMATNRGILELKFFFTNAVGDGDVSAESVRQRIRAMVDAEPADGVLSDDRLVEMLRAEGMDVARRTVAKYRKSLGIGSSVERRRQKALSAGG